MEEREFCGIENGVCFRENNSKVLWGSLSTCRFETLLFIFFVLRMRLL